MKKTTLEIIGIIIISSFLGLVYNQFSAKPIPLIRKPTTVNFVDDSYVDNIMKRTQESKQTTNTINIDTTIVKEEGIKVKDTLIKEEKKDNLLAEKIEPSDQHKSSEEGFKFINYSQLMKYINDPSFLIIDARNDIDFANGHIGNAINIDAYLMDQTEYFKLITMLPRDKVLVIYCSGGNCDASEKLANDIISFGFKNVLVYYGGWEEWKSKMK